MWRHSVLVILAAACGDERAKPSPPAPPRDAATVPGDVIVAPHGRPIVAIAVTDDAAAAISVDADSSVRLWPRLDGTREPVVVPARPAVQLALAPYGDGFVAALIDDAAGIELLRLGADGAVHARRLLPPEPGYVEVAAGAVVVLARRSDQLVERIDGWPQVLAPQPGEHVLAIAARRSSAIAGIADPARPGEIHRVREILVGRGLAWGDPIELPTPLVAPIALSPSGKRIAGISARTGAGIVIELAPTPRVLRDERVVGVEPAVGFIDDEHAVVRGIMLPVSPVAVPADPWDTRPAHLRARVGSGAVVTDGLVVSGHSTHLVLAGLHKTQFLGYRDIGPGFLRVTGEQVTLGFGDRMLWLDASLAAARDEAIVNDAAGGIAVDDHRVLRSSHSYLDDGRGRLTVALVDARTHAEVPLGSWVEASLVAYHPSTHVVAISGEPELIPRLQLDLATNTATTLRPLKARRSSVVELFDPARADGTVAVAVSNGARAETFVDTGTGRTVPPATSIAIPAHAATLGFDERATLYLLDGAHVLGYRAGKQVTKLRIPAEMIGGAVRRDGARFAVFSSTQVAVIDASGRERWRKPLWSVNAARFAPDGARLLVNTQGGLVAFDTETGERVATGCAWNFGLTIIEPPMSQFVAPVVCAEDA